MKIINFGKFILIIFSLLILFSGKPAKAVGQCFCIANNLGSCVVLSQANCVSDGRQQCRWIDTEANCDITTRDYNNQQTRGTGGGTTGDTTRATKSRFIPDCVLEKKLSEKCKDVTIFLDLMFNIIRYLFSIIGGVALLYFVYGGFIMILSQGNSEKVSQGKGVIVAAVLGIIIAFSGYALVQFVGRVVGISNEFKLDSTQ